jgi:hypothetical protein
VTKTEMELKIKSQDNKYYCIASQYYSCIELLSVAVNAIARWKGDHHARNDAQALRLQVAQQSRDDWSATL